MYSFSIHYTTTIPEREDLPAGILQIREEVRAEALAYFAAHPDERECRIVAPHGFFFPHIFPWMAGAIVTREGDDCLRFSPFLRPCAPCAKPKAIQTYLYHQDEWWHAGKIQDIHESLRWLGYDTEDFGVAEWGAIAAADANECEAMARRDVARCGEVAA